MNPNLSVLLVHGDDRERSNLRSAFEALEGVQIVGERAELRAGMAMAHQLHPVILVLEMNGNADDVLSAASQYRLDHPDGAIFLSAEAVQPELLMRAMRAGAQEILRRPLDRSTLGAAVDRVATVIARKHGGARSRSVITVFSNKGGVGVTTLATNLAASVRRQTRREVAIVDFDAQGAAAASMMGVTPARSLADLAAADRIDSTSVQDAITRLKSGVSVLAQPDHIEQAEIVSASQAATILDILAATHDFVIVDAPHGFSDLSLEVFDRSSTVLLVTELNITSLRAARRAIDVFQRLNYLVVPDRVRLVINRRMERSPITPAQARETLGLPVVYTIENDYAAVSEALNLGRPLCQDNPASSAGRDIDTLVRGLVPTEPAAASAAPAPPRRPRLRLFGKG